MHTYDGSCGGKAGIKQGNKTGDDNVCMAGTNVERLDFTTNYVGLMKGLNHENLLAVNAEAEMSVG